MIRCNECAHGKLRSGKVAEGCLNCNGGDRFIRSAQSVGTLIRNPIVDGRVVDKNNICHPQKFQKPFNTCNVDVV